MTMKIAVVGAGIMGRLLAWQLARQEHKVCLFDKDELQTAPKQSNSAGGAAAGMLAPYSEMESAELPIFELGIQALSLWPDIVRALDTEIPDNRLSFTGDGSLIVAHPNDQAELTNLRRQIEHRLPSVDSKAMQLLDKHALAEHSTTLAARFNNAIYFPTEACVAPAALLDTLKDSLITNGVKWHGNTFIERLDRQAMTTQFAHFDWVIDTRGLGANTDVSGLRGVRGETILLHAPDAAIKQVVRLMHPRYKLYLAPRDNDHYMIGATQIESGDQNPITVRSALELLSAAYTIDDSFAEARIVSTHARCRPALPDNLPIISRDQRLIRINGLYRHGVLLSPAIAEKALQLINQPSAYPATIDNLLQGAKPFKQAG